VKDRENSRGFEIIDKRGSNNPIQEPRPVVVEAAEPILSRRWTSLEYMLAIQRGPGGEIMVMGRVAALDQEENVFVADYILSPRWEPGSDWTVQAKRRLDTFLDCPCSPAKGMCPFHQKMAPDGWIKEDAKRIEQDGKKTVSKVIEVLSKAEATRQNAQRILAPRR
jgi:hypothetical protein